MFGFFAFGVFPHSLCLFVALDVELLGYKQTFLFFSFLFFSFSWEFVYLLLLSFILLLYLIIYIVNTVCLSLSHQRIKDINVRYEDSFYGFDPSIQ